MSNVVIADSTCLIGLSKVGQLDILRQLFTKITVPPAVYREVVVLGANQIGAAEIKRTHWIEIETVQNQLAVKTLQLTLGAGESEAIILASEQLTDFLILDDRKARQAALALALPVIGTLAVLKKAQAKGIITNEQVIIEALRQVGFRLPKL